MAKITAGAGLGIKLQFAKFQSLEPSFWIGMEEEVPDDWTLEQKLERAKEIQSVCRQEIEDKIDEDISKIFDEKVFDVIRKKQHWIDN